MNLKSTFLTAVTLFGCYASNAYTNISVNDPRNGGLWANGNIKSASVSITPQGDYFYYDLQLELAVGKTSRTDKYDSLEVACNFDLPAGAFIKTAALLIEDKWVDALLMPRKEAHAIYEGVVQRRKDPLIIYKNSGDNYLFKIFPLSLTGSRTMKMTYAIAASSLAGNKSAGLPTALIQASETPVDMKILIKKSDDFPDPKIAGNDQAFKPSASNPDYLEASISSSTLMPEIISSQKTEAARFSSSTNKADVTYKFSFKATEVFGLSDAKKYLFIIDNDPQITYDTIYTSKYDTVQKQYVREVYRLEKVLPISNDVLYTELARLLSSTSAGDQFNVVLKNDGIYQASSTWIDVSPSAIETAINNLKSNDDSYKADIKKLLISATDLVNATDVTPILISNNNQVGRRDYNKASAFAAEVKAALSYNKSLAIWDISSVSESSTRYYYYYNAFLSYLNSQLSRSNYYYSIQIYNRSSFLSNFLNLKTQALSKILLLNINTYSDKGIIYDRSVSNPAMMIPTNDYTELGKITEGTKFFAEVSFRYKGKLYMKKFEYLIDGKENNILDDAWAVQMVNSLNNTYSTEAIAEAEQISADHKILTQNTAFLSLEPGVVVEPCKDCPDWNNWTGIPVWRWDVPVMSIAGSKMLESNSIGVATMATTTSVSTSTTTPTTGGTDLSASYYELGFKAGKSEGETNCTSSADVAYNQGYQKGLEQAKLTQTTSISVGDDVFRAYPSPFKNELTIEIGLEATVTVSIYDVNGKFIESFKVSKNTTINNANSTIAALPSGVYVLKAIVNGVTKQITIVKE